MNNLKIVSVAIKFAGQVWSLPPPARHHDVIRWIAESNGVGINGPHVQGFISSDAKFVGREKALKIALSAKQVLNVNDVRAGELFSENLW